MKIDNRTDKRKLGDIGENAVTALYEHEGFAILDRNYLRKWGELDIIAKKEGKIHFIEVKSISYEISKPIESGFSHENKDIFRPEDNLHPEKLKRLKRAIQTYIIDKHVSDDTQWQFDVATVRVDQDKKLCKVNILENLIL